MHLALAIASVHRNQLTSSIVLSAMIHESDAEESADEELPIRTAKEQVKAELADAVDDGEQQNGNEKDSEEGDEDEDDDEDDSAEV